MGVDEKLKKAGQQLTDSLKQNTDLSAEEIRRITSENQQQLQTIADEQKAQDDASINNLATAQQAAEQSGADMVLEMGNQLKEAQQEGEAQVEADNRAARWTSAAELAASIANMIGVGSFGAVNQQYKSYSQDWMKKAEQDIREHRSRMDNLNERLRAQKQKLDALKLGNAQALEGLRMRANNNYNDMRASIANAGMRGAEKAAEVESAGRQAAAATAYSVEKDAASAAMQQSRMNQEDRHFNARMAAQGLNPDGSINPTLYSQIAAMENAAKGRSGSGTDKLIAYPILDKDGNVNVANMKPDEMKGLLTFAQGVIRDELGESEGKKFETEFRKAADAAAKNAVLVKWMKESKACGTAIRLIDANYKGQHGIGEGVASATPAPASGNTKTNINNGVNPKTGLSTSYQ